MIQKTGAMFFYDEAGHLLQVASGTGVMAQEIVWMGDTPVATLRPKTGGGVDIYYIHVDHLNTPRFITRPSDNKLRWRWDSDPFGGGAANENPESLGTFASSLRLPGQVYFSEAGLHYNYFRDYDPATGRYPQSDPIGLRGGINTYAYVGGNPINRIDPSGLQAIPYPVPPLISPVTGPGTHVPGPYIEGEWIKNVISGAQNIAQAIKDFCSGNACQACTPYAKGTIGYIGHHTES